MPGHNADRASSTIRDNVANSGHNTLISGVDPVVGRQRSITARSIGSRMAIDVNILDAAGDQISTFGGGQQYTEGDVDTTISGTAMLWEDAGDTLRPVSSTKPLPVQIMSGGSAGQQYAEGDIALTATGTMMMWKDTGDVLAAVTPANPLPVEVLAGSTSSTEYTEGDIDSTITGVAFLWEDTSDTLRPVSSAKPLPVNFSNTTLAVTQSGAWTVGVSGSVTVSATALDIRALTSASDSVSAVQSGSWTVGITGTVPLPTGAATEATLGSVLTSVQLLDDAIYTDALGTPSKGIAVMGTDGTNPQLIKTDVNGELQVDVLTMPSVTVTASGLDIRALASATDFVSAVQSGVWNITNISGTISLPTGAASAANQATEITALQLIDDIVHSGNSTPSKYALIGAVFDDVTTAAVTENNAHALRMSSRRALLVEGVSGGTALTVSATSLDIRSLSSAADSVSAVQSGSWTVAVSGTAAVTQSGTWNVGLTAGDNTVGRFKLTDGTLVASIRDTGTSDSLNVAIVDAAGNQITSFGGGTQYTEGDIDATVTGTALMWEDAADTLRVVSAAKPLPVDITDSTLAVTQSGAWNITNISGTVSLPTGAATSAKQPALGTAGAASADVITVQGVTGMTALKVDGSGVTQPVSGTVSISGSVSVTGTFWQATQPVSLASVPSHAVTNAGTFVTQENGAALTALQLIDDIVLAEDNPHTTGDKGVMMLGVRQDVQASFGIDGDYTPFSLDANGALRVSGGGGGTEYTVDGALGATPIVKLTGFKRDDALSALTPIEGDAVEGRVDANGAIWVTLGTKLDKVNDSFTAWFNTIKDGTGTAYVPLVDADGHQQVDVLTIPSVTVSSAPAIAAGTNLIGRISGSDETGTIYNGTTALTPKHAIITASASGNTAVVAAVATKKIRVLAYNYMANGTVNAKFQSNVTDKTGLAYLIANTGKVAGYNKAGWFETNAGEALNINLSAAIAVGGEITYVEV